MRASEIVKVISEIAQKTPSQKIELISNALENEGFKRFVNLALNPSLRYGVTWKKEYDQTVVGEEDLDFSRGAPDVQRILDIKGSDSFEELLRSGLNRASMACLEAIIDKDLMCGAGIETINKAVPGTISVFKCMLAHKYEESRIKDWPAIVQPKLDGIRVIAIGSANDQFIFYTRTGKEITSLNHISFTLMRMLKEADISEPMVFDSEVVAGGFNDTVSQVRKKDQKSEDATLYVFDVMTLEEFQEGNKKTAEERTKLVEQICKPITDCPMNVRAIETWLASNNADVIALYDGVRSTGGEGVIVKPRKGKYVRKRSHDWLKIKDLQSADVKIIGFEAGKHGTKYEHCLGALIVDFNGVEVRVGSGLTDVLREVIWRDQAANLGLLVEVEYHEVTPDGSLRHPRFVRFRDDKPEEDGVGC